MRRSAPGRGRASPSRTTPTSSANEHPSMPSSTCATQRGTEASPTMTPTRRGARCSAPTVSTTPDVRKIGRHRIGAATAGVPRCDGCAQAGRYAILGRVNRGSNRRPVYVLGVAHSGTSILQKMLAYHPDAAWFSQYSLRDGSVPGRRRLPLAGAADRVLRRAVRHDWRKERGGLLGSAIPRPGEAHTLLLYVLAAGSESEAADRLRRVVDEE